MPTLSPTFAGLRAGARRDAIARMQADGAAKQLAVKYARVRQVTPENQFAFVRIERAREVILPILCTHAPTIDGGGSR